MPFTPEERTAYLKLSCLFLDNEMDDIDFKAIVYRLSGVNIPIARMDDMLRYDVFPLLFINFLVTVGMDAFHEEWLIEKIEARVSSPPWFLRRVLEALVWWYFADLVRPEWEEVKRRLALRHLQVTGSDIISLWLLTFVRNYSKRWNAGTGSSSSEHKSCFVFSFDSSQVIREAATHSRTLTVLVEKSQYPPLRRIFCDWSLERLS
ncbi:hypothetical protein BD410DRAFT_801628 [Rickenella mellea]|uniref:DUF7079 domain-containing protein n=1 Tax=Rickenella mellea TaxID=50990 RepID=A0A4Y7QBB5_9AGAM|nr:hypothetical protein BD410DRAFT_801628 [Rickenella mellea]